MRERPFGRTGRKVSEIGLGTWQLGTGWGNPFNHEEAIRIHEAADRSGSTFIDTADVYNGGQSESAIGDYISAHPDRFYITTKCGRRLNPHVDGSYTPQAIRGFVEDSITRLKSDHLDMVLLHCPPTSVFRRDDIFAELDRL